MIAIKFLHTSRHSAIVSNYHSYVSFLENKKQIIVTQGGNLMGLFLGSSDWHQMKRGKRNINVHYIMSHTKSYLTLIILNF